MSRRNYTKGSIPYEFVALPKPVVSSDEWQRLTHRGRVLAIDLMGQYTGKNNGRLCPSFEVMRRCGWTSKDQWIKAKRELLACSFAVQTRLGHPPRTAEWIGFTWWRLNWHQSMDIAPTSWPYMNFVTIYAAQPDPNFGRKPGGKTVSVVRTTDRWTAKKGSAWSAVRTDGAA